MADVKTTREQREAAVSIFASFTECEDATSLERWAETGEGISESSDLAKLAALLATREAAAVEKVRDECECLHAQIAEDRSVLDSRIAAAVADLRATLQAISCCGDADTMKALADDALRPRPAPADAGRAHDYDQTGACPPNCACGFCLADR